MSESIEAVLPLLEQRSPVIVESFGGGQSLRLGSSQCRVKLCQGARLENSPDVSSGTQVAP